MKTIDICEDTGSPVRAVYAVPHRFAGNLEKIVIDTQPANLTAAKHRPFGRGMERCARVGIRR